MKTRRRQLLSCILLSLSLIFSAFSSLGTVDIREVSAQNTLITDPFSAITGSNASRSGSSSLPPPLIQQQQQSPVPLPLQLQQSYPSSYPYYFVYPNTGQFQIQQPPNLPFAQQVVPLIDPLTNGSNLDTLTQPQQYPSLQSPYSFVFPNPYSSSAYQIVNPTTSYPYLLPSESFQYNLNLPSQQQLVLANQTSTANNTSFPVPFRQQQYQQGQQYLPLQPFKTPINISSASSSLLLTPPQSNTTSIPSTSQLTAAATPLTPSSTANALAAPTVRNTNLQVQTVASGLSLPTSMAFIGPNDILVLEKNTGMVKRIKDGRVLSPPLLDVSVATNSERGMLGIDVMRLTSSHYYVFLYYTRSFVDGGDPIANRLVRFLFTNDANLGQAQGKMTSATILLNLPVNPGPNHNGGKVMIGPDRNVYTITGDLNRQTKAQNFENGPNADGTSGILRVTPNGGTVGSGILGVTHPLNKYFAYGIRNSFGIDFDPVTGKLWDTENGPTSNDELNLVEPGFNSGWRDLMGVAPAGFNFNNLVDFGGKGKYSNPEFVWTQVVAPTAIEFLSSGRLGTQYQNDMFVADFKNGRIYNFNLNGQRNALVLPGVLSDRVANTDSEVQSVIFGEGFGGITDLKVGLGDGYLYVLSLGKGAIYKILPK